MTAGWNETYRRTHVDSDGSPVVVLGYTFMTRRKPIAGRQTFVKGAKRWQTQDGREVCLDGDDIILSECRTPLPLFKH